LWSAGALACDIQSHVAQPPSAASCGYETLRSITTNKIRNYFITISRFRNKKICDPLLNVLYSSPSMGAGIAAGRPSEAKGKSVLKALLYIPEHAVTAAGEIAVSKSAWDFFVSDQNGFFAVASERGFAFYDCTRIKSPSSIFRIAVHLNNFINIFFYMNGFNWTPNGDKLIRQVHIYFHNCSLF
jgi:hypothetical protein